LLGLIFHYRAHHVKNSIKIPPTSKGRKASTHSATDPLARSLLFPLLPAHLTTHKRVSMCIRTKASLNYAKYRFLCSLSERAANKRIYFAIVRAQGKKSSAQCIEVCVSRSAQKVHFKYVSFAPENSKHFLSASYFARHYVKLKRCHLSSGNFAKIISPAARDTLNLRPDCS